MTRNRPISRRLMLGSSMAAVLLAPLLRQRELHAQSANPKRLVLVFTPDSHPPEWWPTRGSSPSDFTLNEPLADFAGLERQMLFVRRIDHSWSFDNHHEAGIAQLFTGQTFFDDASHYANGPSIDQLLLANSDLRGGTPIPSIHLCAGDRGGTDKRHIISYSGPGQPIAHQPNPATAFSDIFDGVTFGAPTEPPGGEPPVDLAAESRKNVRRRILELNTEELRRIQRYLGNTEKQKLDAHVTALLELQNRIVSGPGGGGPPVSVGGTCERVDTGGVDRDDRDHEAIAHWAQVQADIIVNAFTCDVTRVADFHFGFSGSHHNGMMGFSGASNSTSWHDNVAHISRTNDAVTLLGETVTTRQAFITFDRFWAGHVAYLAKRLASIAEGDGTMLDNTLIYWGVESGTNHNHSESDMQYLLIGGKNMGFASGQYLDFGGSAQSAHKLHTSVLHAFGYEAAGFGVEPNCGPLAGVLV